MNVSSGQNPNASYDDFSELAAIGLTKTQAQCYSALNKRASLSVGKLAGRFGVNRTNLYPLLKDMQRKGFVQERHFVGINRYQAVPLQLALGYYFDYQRRQVNDLTIKQQSQ